MSLVTVTCPTCGGSGWSKSGLGVCKHCGGLQEVLVAPKTAEDDRMALPAVNSWEFVIPGRAYPHPRVTHWQIKTAIGHRDRGERLTSRDLSILRYLDYREAVSLVAMAACIPQITTPAEFTARFWFRDHTHGDRANLVKAAEDGFAAGGAVKNDRLFLADGGSRIFYGSPERTEITIRLLGEAAG